MLHTTMHLIIEKCTCKQAFIFLHDISEKQFKNITKHLKINGPVPIIHGNTGKVPKTTYSYEVNYDSRLFSLLKILQRFMVCPNHLQGVAKLIFSQYSYLPASDNYKIVYDIYVKSVMEKDASQRVMQYRSFVDVWHKCLPEVQFMTPRTDVCAVCDKYRNKITQQKRKYEVYPKIGVNRSLHRAHRFLV